jgi:phytoene dehydrogenase-like protein
MRQHGVNFQPPLSGALHVARTNAFFMGGGKALVNAYYRSAEQMGVQIRYNTPVQARAAQRRICRRAGGRGTDCREKLRPRRRRI